MVLKSINPATNKVIGEYNALSDSEVLKKLKQANATQKSWSHTSYADRKALLIALAHELKKEKQQLADLMHHEMGKIIPEGLMEIEKCAWVCEYYAEYGEEFLADSSLEMADKSVSVVYQPLGVVLAIMPWNFPFWQVFRFIAPALMAGNTGVLKHAPNVSGCALAIEKLFNSVEATNGVFQTLLIDVPQVGSIIANPIVKAVTLTGSVKAGKSVAALAGKYVKKAVLELGGSDPFIVLSDVDLMLAVGMGVKSRMLNTGQSCIAAKRFIVVEDVYDQFVKAFENAIMSLKKDRDYGPMARVDLAEELERQVNKSVDEGAELVCGGNRDEAYFEPTILTNVVSGMPAYTEELFGPVASIMKVKSIDEAIEVANDTHFGLGASVWTCDLELGKKVADKIESGSVFINQMVASDPRIPFGGIKNSGYGRELGLWGIREFVNIKPIVV